MARKRPLREGIMLATTLTPNYLYYLPNKVLIQRKLKGVRARVEWFHEDPVFVSSYANIIKYMEHIEEELRDLVKIGWPKIGYDGELYIHGASQEEINSATGGRTNRPKRAGEVTFVIYDIYNATQSDQLSRIGILQFLEQKIYQRDKRTHFVKILETKAINKAEWEEHLIQYVNEGYEGIIIRDPESYYETKRVTKMLKFKPSEIDEYEIVEILPGEGRLSNGYCGSIVVKDAEGIHFNVGSGFSDQERKEIWDRRNELPGKMLRVKHEPVKTRNGIPICTRALEIVE